MKVCSTLSLSTWYSTVPAARTSSLLYTHLTNTIDPPVSCTTDTDHAQEDL
jgi:hypothetical protein